MKTLRLRAPLGLLSFLLAPVLGCEESNTPAMAMDLGKAPTAMFVVAGSDFMSGGLSTVELPSLNLRKSFDAVGPQAVVRGFGTKVYVLNQDSGTVRTYDTARDFAGPLDSPVTKASEVPGAQANPHDFYVDAPRNTAYVTLYGSYGSTVVTGARALGVIDLMNAAAGVQRFIPLAVDPADPDGNPDASDLEACGDTLYVLLQSLNRNKMYEPAAPGRLAVIDLKNPTAATYIPLTGENPIRLRMLPGCSEALVASAGNQLVGMLTGKSGIERVDLTAKKSLGLALKDTDLGGNVSAFDAASLELAFVDVSSRSGMNYNNDVYAVNLKTGQKGQKLLGPMNYVPAVRVAEGQLAVLSASAPKAGQLKVGMYLGPANGTPLPVEPLDTGLPPISIDVAYRP